MLRTLLFLSILVPGLYAAFRSRYAALLLYFWFAFFRPQDYLWWDISSLQLSLWLGILLVVPAFLSGAFPNVSHPLSLGALAFLGSAAIAQLGAVNPEIGWYWLDALARLLLVALLATTLVTDRKKLLLAVMVIAISFGFHATKAGLSSILSGGARFFVGLGGAYSDNNAYGIAMAMIAPLVLVVAQNTTSRYMRWGCRAAVPLIAIGVVGTYSRSGFLALIAALLTMVAFQKRRALWFTLAGAVAVPVVFFMAQQEGYLARMATIRTYETERETSALSRLHFWRVATDIAIDRPFGIGLFNYESAYDRYDSLNGEFGTKRSVHSSHFQVLAENGVIGFAAWTFLFGYSVVVIFRVRRRAQSARDPADRQAYLTVPAAFLASIAAFLVGGSFIAMSLNDLTWVTFALLAALDRVSAGTAAAEHGSLALQPSGTTGRAVQSGLQLPERAS